jgi:hypothetical protein
VSVNQRTRLDRIVMKAGYDSWRRFMQNLRSYETDWVKRCSAHAVATWLGHSPNVAAEHYLMSRAHHFEDVVGGGKRSDGSAGQGSPGGCDAKCNAISPDRVQLLARAVAIVAGMRIPEQMQAAVLDRVITDLGEHPMPQP